MESIGQLLIALEVRYLTVFVSGGSAAQVHRNAQANGIHDRDCAGQVLGGAIDVLMDIDQPMFLAPGYGQFTVRLAGGGLGGSNRWCLGKGE